MKERILERYDRPGAGEYLSSKVFEILSRGDSAHLAVRFPVRIQALDNELRHLQTEGRRHAAQLC